MAKVRSWAGLDVHARKVLAATMDSESGELCVRRLSGKASEVVEFCASLSGPTGAVSSPLRDWEAMAEVFLAVKGPLGGQPAPRLFRYSFR